MLITTNDIRKHRPVAGNLDDMKRLEMYIREAETLHVLPAIGAELYKEVDENPSVHTLLLDGGYYNNNTCYMAGLKAAISLLAYSRFVLNNSINATPFGVKEKLTLDSGNVTDKALHRHANEAEKTGLAYLQQCIEYLNFTDGKCRVKRTSTGTRKFKSVGR
jgi:hypothetical protein